jgi:hypothetical protein
MQIAIPLFDDLTALDAIGPYEVLSRLPGADVVFVGSLWKQILWGLMSAALSACSSGCDWSSLAARSRARGAWSG